MSALAKEGLLVSRHGKGTFITGMPAARSIAICTRVNLFSAYQAHWGVRLLERMRNVVETHGYRALTVVAHGDTVAEQQASQQPRRPQPQAAPFCRITMWPISPAIPPPP